MSKSWWCLACILVPDSTPSKTMDSGNQNAQLRESYQKKASSMEEMPEDIGPEDIK